ncbi:hypothetical protein UPYG_G00308760 [Umbra pygmaea]|uniref:Ig-like domain-containing protein n=1 Tax=Umbra pygmaea TaxID=75934 RepID=A0ABD0W061_UMBPY
MAMLLLIWLIFLSLRFSDAEKNCVYAAEGKPKLIDLEYEEGALDKKLHLKWTHGSKIYYNSKKTTEQKYPITSNGSLILNNVQLENNGTYQATIYNDMGRRVKFTETALCVLSPVFKPKVTQTCTGPNFKLWCDVGKPVSVDITWSLNEIKLLEHTDTTLEVTKATLKPEDRYTCTASNPVSMETSDDFKPRCTEPVSKPSVKYTCNSTAVILTCDFGNSAGVYVTWSRNGEQLPGNKSTTINVVKATLEPRDRYACTASDKSSEEKSDDVNIDCKGLLFGMELWLMVLILGSGGSLLLMLLMIILICVCRSHRQQKRHLEEEELRLTPLTQPTRQCSLNHPPQNPQTRPKNKARAQPNYRPQARPRPQQPLPDKAEPIAMPRSTRPRKHKS